MRNYVRRPQQVLAREMEEQLRLHILSVEEELSWWMPEDEALLDAYEAGFIKSYDPDFDDWDGTTVTDEMGGNYYEDDFHCCCEDCRMQDY